MNHGKQLTPYEEKKIFLLYHQNKTSTYIAVFTVIKPPFGERQPVIAVTGSIHRVQLIPSAQNIIQLVALSSNLLIKTTIRNEKEKGFLLKKEQRSIGIAAQAFFIQQFFMLRLQTSTQHLAAHLALFIARAASMTFLTQSPNRIQIPSRHLHYIHL